MFFPIIFSIAGVIVPHAYAQQASSHGMTGNMNLYRLEHKVQSLQEKLGKRDFCEKQGKIYLPANKKADEKGCIAFENSLPWGFKGPASTTCKYNGRYKSLKGRNVKLTPSGLVVDSQYGLSLAYVYSKTTGTVPNSHRGTAGQTTSSSCSRLFQDDHFITGCRCSTGIQVNY